MKRIYMLNLLFFAALFCSMSSASATDAPENPYSEGHTVRQLDTVKTFVALPRGMSYTYGNVNIRSAFEDLIAPSRNPECELVRFIVAGCASPDGLWAYNVTLSEDRTKNTVQYLKALGMIPAHKIQGEYRYEDWNMLYEMVQKSNLECKEEVKDIIRTKTWGERKTALKAVADGRVWKIFETEFFPFMRGVELSVVYNRPVAARASASDDASQSKTAVQHTRKEEPAHADTVYVTDTVYIYRDQVPAGKNHGVNVTESRYEQAQEDESRSPWRFGIKTNLLSDAIAVPSLGLEFQMGRYLSLDLQGWWTGYNMFVPADKNALFYGVSPELRWWLKGNSMTKGSFLGVHGNCAWYSMQWSDGLLYQNLTGDTQNISPAWSVGLTYGYSLGLGRKANWGLEFVVGAGYLKACQNVADQHDGVWVAKEYQEMTGFGLTKAAVNLTYRFPIKR
jgi:hypothetical protein